ncbi:MAG: hypothetical protein A49_07810 [Methyloceanibacter sp.]|nr:MAG: hypothetical protein A49_07810 [Methyloceanibacter sp.]
MPRLKIAQLCEHYLRPFFRPNRPHYKVWEILAALEPSPRLAADLRINTDGAQAPNEVDEYWSGHTVQAFEYRSKLQSRLWLAFRFQLYPQFKEFMELYGHHSGKTVVDFGCGPGNDVLGFALYSGAARVIGIDVSPKALEIARMRLALHGIGGDEVDLILSSDSTHEIPLETGSVDHVYCEGVLMHTGSPETYLREFHRILSDGGGGHLMVYNRDSVWYHLYSSYVLKIARSRFAEFSDMEVFQRSTDGENCPLARNYTNGEFLSMLRTAGFEADYVGGYLSLHELKIMDEFLEAALEDERLDQSHRDFLARLESDREGFPTFEGKAAGIGGVYRIRKA